MAGVTARDIEFAELHDCFTIAEIIATEDLGFVPRGHGGPYVLEGRTCLNGERPVNASGGLSPRAIRWARPASGQICDVVTQIRGEAGELQVAAAFAWAGGEPGRLGRDGRGDDPGGRMKTGTVYTETVVHVAPEQFPADAPYQLAIVTLRKAAAGARCGSRVTRGADRRCGRVRGRTQRHPVLSKTALKIFLYLHRQAARRARQCHGGGVHQALHPLRHLRDARDSSRPFRPVGRNILQLSKSCSIRRAAPWIRAVNGAVRPRSGVYHRRSGRLAGGVEASGGSSAALSTAHHAA